MRTAAVRPFTPSDSEPSQIVDHGAAKFWPRALRIEVFIPKYQRAPIFDRALRSDPERARMADMQQATRRWRKAPAIRVLGILCHELNLGAGDGNSTITSKFPTIFRFSSSTRSAGIHGSR